LYISVIEHRPLVGKHDRINCIGGQVMQRRIIKNVLKIGFLVWTAFMWLKVQWFPVFNVVMKGMYS
jgi:hypothetical protein